jgi:hypothetical protein
MLLPTTSSTGSQGYPFEQQHTEAAQEQFKADGREQEVEEHFPSSSIQAEDEAGEENAFEEEQGGSQEILTQKDI